MKKIISIIFFAVIAVAAFSQEQPIHCNGNADALPGKYTDHTQTKYASSLKGAELDKAAILKQLIAIEKSEETSRNNFQLTGCVARVSFSGGNKNTFGNIAHVGYGYQLGVYQNVCHVTEHIVKTVGEYRTVLRVDINPMLNTGGSFYGWQGDFYITDKSVRYEISVDAKLGANYEKDRVSNKSSISSYISEESVLASRSDNYKDKHGDFLKLINGNGYVENWMGADRYAKHGPNSYQWIDRHYLITKPGVPVLMAVTRKEYLEALLEFYEIEKVNFLQTLTYKKNGDAKSSSAEAKNRMSIYEADKNEYLKIYENKKNKVQQLLTSQKSEWLQKPAVVKKQLRENDYAKASNGLLDFNNFYDGDEQATVLYQYNPEYYKMNANQPTKPILIEVQFRYEIAEDKGFSERIFNNFLKNYDMDALRKMVE